MIRSRKASLHGNLRYGTEKDLSHFITSAGYHENILFNPLSRMIFLRIENMKDCGHLHI